MPIISQKLVYMCRIKYVTSIGSVSCARNDSFFPGRWHVRHEMDVIELTTQSFLQHIETFACNFRGSWVAFGQGASIHSVPRAQLVCFAVLVRVIRFYVLSSRCAIATRVLTNVRTCFTRTWAAQFVWVAVLVRVIRFCVLSSRCAITSWNQANVRTCFTRTWAAQLVRVAVLVRVIRFYVLSSRCAIATWA